MSSPSPTVSTKRRNHVSTMDVHEDYVSVDEALRLGFDTMEYADFVIACADGRVPCHRVQLAAASPFIKSIFELNPEAYLIIVPDIKLETMKQVLSIFYTGQVCSNMKEDFEDVKQAIDLFGLNIDPLSWVIENVSIASQEPMSVPKPLDGSVLSHLNYESDCNDDVKIIEEEIKSFPIKSNNNEGPSVKKRKVIKNKQPIKQRDNCPTPQLQQLQNLVNILPKNYVPAVPMPMQPMFVATPSTSDVIQAMLQSRQLSLGPAFTNGAIPQYYQQSHSTPTYVTGIHPGLSTATATTYVNSPGVVPMHLGYYPQGQGQAVPQQHHMRSPVVTALPNGTVFQNSPVTLNNLGIPINGHGLTARMVKSTGGGSLVSNGTGQHGTLQGDANNTDRDDVVYIVEDNFFGSTDENNSTHSEQSGEFEGEEIEILGWNVEDQENEFQMTEAEIMSNAQVSSQKDHAYAFYAPKETRRERKRRLQSEALNKQKQKKSESL